MRKPKKVYDDEFKETIREEIKKEVKSIFKDSKCKIWKRKMKY